MSMFSNNQYIVEGKGLKISDPHGLCLFVWHLQIPWVLNWCLQCSFSADSHLVHLPKISNVLVFYLGQARKVSTALSFFLLKCSGWKKLVFSKQLAAMYRWVLEIRGTRTMMGSDTNQYWITCHPCYHVEQPCERAHVHARGDDEALQPCEHPWYWSHHRRPSLATKQLKRLSLNDQIVETDI
jgi:hypothetical protein